MFADRSDAGKKLAGELSRFRGTDAVVLALPRGGVVVGYEIARALVLPLDIIAVRKVGHPSSPEYAIGAVDEKGTTILNETETREVDQTWLKQEIAREKKEAMRRCRTYRAGALPARIGGKTAIIVDDGIATGLTMGLAVRAAKARRPKAIVVAVPVAPPGSAKALMGEGADEVVVLEPPEEFAGAVGAHYARFEQVEDDKVREMLAAARGADDAATIHMRQ